MKLLYVFWMREAVFWMRETIDAIKESLVMLSDTNKVELWLLSVGLIFIFAHDLS